MNAEPATRLAVAEARVALLESHALELEKERNESREERKQLQAAIASQAATHAALASLLHAGGGAVQPAKTPRDSPLQTPTAAGPTVPGHTVAGVAGHTVTRHSASSGHNKKKALDVIMSYNTKNYAFMVQLRTALRARGFSTTDGSEVPPGKDWRRYYFPALCRAKIFMPILSDTFLFSTACEDECTFAWDKRKPFVPIACKNNYCDVLRNPGEFYNKRADLEDFLPKFESMFNQCNRFPPAGNLSRH